MGKGEIVSLSNFSFSLGIFSTWSAGMYKHGLNSLPNNKVLDQSKFKDLADDNKYDTETELYFG